jgi:hypothetical protein
MSEDLMLAALARLEAGQTQLRTDLLGELASTRAGIMERPDRQQAKLDAIDGLLTMGLGHADEAQAQAQAAMATTSGRINAEQIATLRDLFRKLEARVRHLEEK